jgi:adenine deaminase
LAGSPNPIVWLPLSSPSPSDAIKTGPFYLPVDRKSQGLIMLMSANVFNQNIVLVGASDEDMAGAANETIRMGGGFIAFRKGKVVASLPTPLNGLATDKPFDEVFAAQRKLREA